MHSLKTLGICALLAGCAGSQDYVRPSSGPAPANNSVLIDKPRQQVWDSSIPRFGARFFTINTLDKSSGLINLSYSGNPERYIDCGIVTSYVKNARGERVYKFAGSSPKETYELMDMQRGGVLLFIDRQMQLEGKINMIFEEVSSTQTRVTAQVRYVVTRNQVVRTADGRSGSASDVGSFTTGGVGTITGPGTQPLDCQPTGALEAELLAAVQ